MQPGCWASSCCGRLFLSGMSACHSFAVSFGEVPAMELDDVTLAALAQLAEA